MLKNDGDDYDHDHTKISAGINHSLIAIIVIVISILCHVVNDDDHSTDARFPYYLLGISLPW